MNARSLGYRTEELIHESDLKRCMTQISFSSVRHGLFVCHSFGPQIEGLAEQCQISAVSGHINTKQGHRRKMPADGQSAVGVYGTASVSRPPRRFSEIKNSDRRSFVSCSTVIFLSSARHTHENSAAEFF